MDRRNYRGSSGHRNMHHKPMGPDCGDMMGRYTSEDMCDGDDFEREFDRDYDRFPIGMCYVPWQCFRDLYENEFVALENGTLFKELDLNWYGRGCK